MEPNFRTAVERDSDLLLDFMRDFYAIDGYPFDEPAAREALSALIKDGSLGRVWVIELENMPVGYLVLAFGYSLEYRGRDAFIDELYIQAEHRNLGIGGKAMQFVERACAELGVKTLHLEVERQNAAGQALYKKFGFEEHDRCLMTKAVGGRRTG